MSAVLAHRLEGGGDAVPLLLLNGGFMTIGSWQPCAALLAPHVPVLRCDFRGQLLTPGPPHSDVADNVADVVALLDHLGVSCVHVLGTSFGGEVALLLAARHPERVATLVAVTVTDRATEPMRRGAGELRRVAAEALAGGDRGSFHDALVADIHSPAYVGGNAEALTMRRRQIAALPDRWFSAVDGLLHAVERLDLGGELAGIRRPTLVVVAGDDRVTLAERGRAVAAAIPGARLVEHPTSGHALFAEQPAWLVEQTLAFLRLQPSPTVATPPGRAGCGDTPGRRSDPDGTALRRA